MLRGNENSKAVKNQGQSSTRGSRESGQSQTIRHRSRIGTRESRRHTGVGAGTTQESAHAQKTLNAKDFAFVAYRMKSTYDTKDGRSRTAVGHPLAYICPSIVVVIY
jgi:hypothetical protein